MKYILYYKQLYIVKEQLTKNRSFQSWRGKQLAMSESKEALIEYAKGLFGTRDCWYIEERPD